MSLYRGTGGATSVSGDATVEQVLQASTDAQAAAAAASASQSAAASSASNASTSASNAATQVTLAQAEVTNAQTEVANAATEVTYAAEWADKAEDSLISVAAGGDGATDYSALHWANKASASAAAAASSYDSFDDRYLGAKASEPTLDNDGDPLLTGALYFNSTTNDLWVYNGSAWEQATLTAGSFLVTGDIGVTVQGYDVDTAKLDVAQTFTADQTFQDIKALQYQETFTSYVPTGTTQTIDTATGTVFSLDLGSATGTVTLTFSNPPTTGTAYGMTIKVIQGATARAITWPASVDWPAATAPTLSTGNDNVDVFVFYTHDGGTTWYGFTSGQAMG